jgi:hypothetical protein
MEATLTHQVMDERRECAEPHARAHSPRLGKGRGRTTCAWMLHRNPAPRLVRAWLTFVVLFFCCLAVKFRILTDRYKDLNWTRRTDRIADSYRFAGSALYKAPDSQHQTHPNFCLCLQLRRHRSSLHPDRRRASAIGRGGLRNPSPSRFCTGRGRIRFLGSVLTRLLAILLLNPDASTSSALLLRCRRPCWFRPAPSISMSDQYALSDLTLYFSSSDLVMIYIRNLIWKMSNNSTKKLSLHLSTWPSEQDLRTCCMHLIFPSCTPPYSLQGCLQVGCLRRQRTTHKNILEQDHRRKGFTNSMDKTNILHHLFIIYLTSNSICLSASRTFTIWWHGNVVRLISTIY